MQSNGKGSNGERNNDEWGTEETVARQGDRHADVARTYSLVGVSGPGLGETYRIPFSAPHRFYVGKSERCDARIADQQISRRHLALDVRDGALHVTDLDSTNGTFVNGLRVVEAVLQGGETIRVGATLLWVEATDQTPEHVPSAMEFGRVLGASVAMRKLYPFCQKLAQSALPVVIEGETGTGKELLAESLHEQGPRAAGPFVVFDCTAVAPSLVEAALFGYERGAYTGAESSQPGVFERAHGGTLFIDEIGDLDIGLQAKLLRAVERSEVRRIGGAALKRVDVRVLCATRRDLERAIQEGRFRDDLFHRLAVTRLELPPLRYRHGDVQLLAQYFWSQLGGETMSPALIEKLATHSFPGNVRELRNMVARAIALGDLAPPEAAASPASHLDHSDGVTARVLADNIPYMRARDIVMADFRRRFVEHALERHGGSVPKAAAAAGVSRRYFDKIRGKDRDDG